LIPLILLLEELEEDSSDEEDNTKDKEDEEDEDDRRARLGSPQITLFSKAETSLTLWKNNFAPNFEFGKDFKEYSKHLQSYKENTCWVFFFCCGGYFAGAVFNGNKLLKHRTFRR
jgi:hypothetical protein